MGSFQVPPGIAVQPNATIDGGSTNARRMTTAKHREMNDNFIFVGDANLTHIPQFWVGIFNVSNIEHRIERPWVHPTRRGQLILIPACEDDQPYGKPFIIPDIIQTPIERAGSWELSTRGVDGRFLAQDALNPEDMRGSYKTVRPASEGLMRNEGTNLYHLGCFWITAPTVEELIPTQDELDLANDRLDARANLLIQEASLFYLQGAQGIQQIGNLHRWAANRFPDVEVEWNKKYTRRMPCPECGAALMPTAAVCTKCPCVINWTRAIERGLRTKEQAIAAGVMQAQAEATEKKSRKEKE